MAEALSWIILTPCLARPPYLKVMLSMVRTPLSTRLLNGQEMNSRFGSSSTTSMLGSSTRMYLAAVAPPQPPPMTTTRRPVFGMKSPFMPVAHPPSPATDAAASPRPAPERLRNSLRVNGFIGSSPSEAAWMCEPADGCERTDGSARGRNRPI